MMDNKERKDDLGNIDEFNEKYRHYLSDAEAEDSEMVTEDAETVSPLKKSEIASSSPSGILAVVRIN